MNHTMKICLWVIIVLCGLTISTQAQETLSSDSLLQLARKTAFDEKDYDKAKAYLHRALQKSPDYADIRIFLGRIYTWTKNYDSAKLCFSQVLQKQPGYEDASIAYTDLEYWNDHNEQALQVCNAGLQYHPASEELLLRKARILNAMKQYATADSTIQRVLAINKNNTAARSLADQLKERSYRNKINASYDFVYFDKQFSDPWHLVSIDYGRNTSIGSVTGRLNYANRFAQNALQYELEAYPHISKTFYSYADLAYCSSDNGVFPQWRGGFSLYANLPKSFEGELGFRYMLFDAPTWVYTAYAGKYYKSWLFGARVYITPSTYATAVSNSYTLTANYYYGNADDVIGLTAGYGISPDDRYNAILIDSKVKLTTYKAGISFKKKVSRMNVFTAAATWFNQEYLPGTKGNQYQIGVAWQHRF